MERSHHNRLYSIGPDRIIVLASVIGFFAVFAVWAQRQLLETDTWTETSSELLEDEHIREAVADFLVDSLYQNVNVEKELAGALPKRLKPLAGPASGGLRQLADRAALQALERPRVQLLWEEANRQAHPVFLNVVEGGDETVSTENGVVSLDLRTRCEAGGSARGRRLGRDPSRCRADRDPAPDQLSAAQDAVNLLRKLAIILPLAGLGLYALAIYLARGWRRRALRASGVGFIVIGIAVLVARAWPGQPVDSLTNTAAAEPAASAAWDIGTSLLAIRGGDDRLGS